MCPHTTIYATIRVHILPYMQEEQEQVVAAMKAQSVVPLEPILAALHARLPDSASASASASAGAGAGAGGGGGGGGGGGAGAGGGGGAGSQNVLTAGACETPSGASPGAPEGETPSGASSGAPEGVSHEAVFKTFLQRARGNLHVVLCMSPGARFACFAGTKVQILTQKLAQEYRH